jgi:hypothetical protein
MTHAMHAIAVVVLMTRNDLTLPLSGGCLRDQGRTVRCCQDLATEDTSLGLRLQPSPLHSIGNQHLLSRGEAPFFQQFAVVTETETVGGG